MESNQFVRAAELSMRVTRSCVAAYACVRSRHDFTQRQLLTCLVLRAQLKMTYRGITDLLELTPVLREVMGMEKVPHYTTLQKFAARPDVPDLVCTLLAGIIRELGGAEVVKVETAAMDSTGLSKTLASAHFLSRSGRGSRRGPGRYVKIAVIILCGSLLPCALTIGHGPRSDACETGPLLEQARRVIHPGSLAADCAFDAEWVHEYCREDWGVESWIPPIVRTRDGSVRTPHRSRMLELPEVYRKRWHVEAFFSGLKRTTGSGLTARLDQTLFNEAALRVLAYATNR